MMAEIARLRELLGVSDAPLVTTGLLTTARFFEDVLNVDPVVWWEYLRGIDFHSPISVSLLTRDHRLVQYVQPGFGALKPFGYFTDRGVSPYHLGISWPMWMVKEYNVLSTTLALKSTASGISFDSPLAASIKKQPWRPDRTSRPGGGTQYIISRADWPKLLRVGDAKHAY